MDNLSNNTGKLFMLAFTNLIVTELANSTINKIQENVNKFIDSLPTQFSQDNEKLGILTIPNKGTLTHSQSPRYPTGEVKPFEYDISVLNAEQLETASNLIESFNTTSKDLQAMRILFKKIYTKIALEYPDTTNIQKAKMLYIILPENIQQCQAVLTLNERNNFLHADDPENSLTPELEQFAQSLKDEKLDSLLNQYDAMSLIADF